MTTYVLNGITVQEGANGVMDASSVTQSLVSFTTSDDFTALLSYIPPIRTNNSTAVEIDAATGAGYMIEVDGVAFDYTLGATVAEMSWGNGQTAQLLVLRLAEGDADGNFEQWTMMQLSGAPLPALLTGTDIYDWFRSMTSLSGELSGAFAPGNGFDLSDTAAFDRLSEDDVLIADTANYTLGGAIIDTGIGDDYVAAAVAAVQVALGAGNDTALGGLGADTLDGGAGNDNLSGAEGNDSLRGGDGADTLNGGAGNDTIIGGDSAADLRDVVYAGAGDDSIDGGYGNDSLRGDDGNDTIEGGFGADTIVGGTGNDVLTGSAWSDLIFGNDGDDFINGGFGNDRVNGGAGADRFYHIGAAGHGSDWIQDYSGADGDVLVFGITSATRAQFQINWATTNGAGSDAVQEAFVVYRPTGQIMWALIDGAANDHIWLQIGANTYDLLA